MKIFCILVLLVSVINRNFAVEFKELFRWTEKNINFLTDEGNTRQQDNSCRNSIQGISIWKNKLFLSIKEIQSDKCIRSSYTLNYVNLNATEKSPPLIPYPTSNKSQPLDVAYTQVVDACDRLWVVDTTKLQILIIDLNTDKILRTVSLRNALDSSTHLISITVDTGRLRCGDAYAYIPSTSSFGLIVYSFREDKHWVVNKPEWVSVNSSPKYASVFSGHRANIYSTALSNEVESGYRILYVQPTSSEFLLTIPTYVLRNADNGQTDSQQFTVLAPRESNKTSKILHYDSSTSNLYYDVGNTNAIGCWNTNKFASNFNAYTTRNIKLANTSISEVIGIQTDYDNLYILGVAESKHESEEGKQTFVLYAVDKNELVRYTVCDWIYE